MAIGIKLKKTNNEHDVSSSKFFGSPTTPLKWESKFASNIIFLAQIRLQDIALLDKDNKLPHVGYLYFFLETEDETAFSSKKSKSDIF